MILGWGSGVSRVGVARPEGSVNKKTIRLCEELKSFAPVAQLDRALPSGGRGQRFESSRARHYKYKRPPCAGVCICLCLFGLEPLTGGQRGSTESSGTIRNIGA